VFLSNELCENDIEIQHFKDHFCPLMKDEQIVSETPDYTTILTWQLQGHCNVGGATNFISEL
jgi:hypothetical protein